MLRGKFSYWTSPNRRVARRMSNLRRRLPPMNTLTAFEAAYRLGSFSRAAEELALSQSSVSRLVRQLEESISERLFSRGRYDVTPTPAGREYIDEGDTGLLHAPGDEATLADAITCLIRDEVLRKRLGTRARARAEKQTWDKTAGLVLAVIENL